MGTHRTFIATYIMASAYTAATHYLKAVQAAGTDEGGAVMARMKAWRPPG